MTHKEMGLQMTPKEIWDKPRPAKLGKPKPLSTKKKTL